MTASFICKARFVLAASTLPALISAASVDPAMGPARYTGPGSCSSSSCHGGIAPRRETSVLQNEYSTWLVKDKHPRAYAVLLEPTGKRMGKILGIQPENAQKCLVCHALNAPPELRARTLDSNDGVSCENCHGPASNWIGPHVNQGWNYAKSVRIGMYDTRDLIKRSERCLSCHLGDNTRSVDHEMIAAGHPDLYFELASFMAVQPKHWQEADQDPWFDVRALAVGQAVQLREHMMRISRRSRNGVWPEYGELDCYACHHSLTTAKDSWRQDRGYPGRPPGNPPFNSSRSAVLENIGLQYDAEAWRSLAASLNEVSTVLSNISSDRSKVAVAAEAAASSANRMAVRFTELRFDGPASLKLMRSICADADRISNQGERAAEQAAMTLDSLALTYSTNSSNPVSPQLRASLDGLFQQLTTPSAYNPQVFSRQMRAVSAAIP